MIQTLMELRDKEVINVCDGKRLGYVCDAEFDTVSSCMISLIVPGKLHYLGFGRCEKVKIPWNCIKQIGSDLILVELFPLKKP